MRANDCPAESVHRGLHFLFVGQNFRIAPVPTVPIESYDRPPSSLVSSPAARVAAIRTGQPCPGLLSCRDHRQRYPVRALLDSPPCRCSRPSKLSALCNGKGMTKYPVAPLSSSARMVRCTTCSAMANLARILRLERCITLRVALDRVVPPDRQLKLSSGEPSVANFKLRSTHLYVPRNVLC